MNEPKPFASLSSGLLARKGQAKPAMRPQGFGTFGAQSTGFDDLGWNDMGHDRTGAPVGLTPMDGDQVEAGPVDADIVPLHADIESEAEAFEPVVFQQREEIERSFETPAEMEEPVEHAGPILMTKRKAAPVFAPVAELVAEFVPEPAPVAVPPRAFPTTTVRAAPGSKARAAFTLRLDADRHLQLRLAAAVAHRSAQALVVEALDAYLANHPAAAGTLPGTAN